MVFILVLLLQKGVLCRIEYSTLTAHLISKLLINTATAPPRSQRRKIVRWVWYKVERCGDSRRARYFGTYFVQGVHTTQPDGTFQSDLDLSFTRIYRVLVLRVTPALCHQRHAKDSIFKSALNKSARIRRQRQRRHHKQGALHSSSTSLLRHLRTIHYLTLAQARRGCDARGVCRLRLLRGRNRP